MISIVTKFTAIFKKYIYKHTFLQFIDKNVHLTLTVADKNKIEIEIFKTDTYVVNFWK